MCCRRAKTIEIFFYHTMYAPKFLCICVVSTAVQSDRTWSATKHTGRLFTFSDGLLQFTKQCSSIRFAVVVVVVAAAVVAMRCRWPALLLPRLLCSTVQNKLMANNCRPFGIYHYYNNFVWQLFCTLFLTKLPKIIVCTYDIFN